VTAIIEQPLTTLKELSDEQLLDLYQSGETQLALAEAKRRDAGDKTKRQVARERAAQRAEWCDMAHAQYLTAEAECKGVLLANDSPIGDPWALWMGTEARAMKHASEELRNFWLDNPRITVGAYRQQVADGRRSIRHEMERDAYYAGLAEHGAGEIRPEAEADAGSDDADSVGRDSRQPDSGPTWDAGSLGAYTAGFLASLRAALQASVEKYAA
jgi:hypothetical protein